MGDAGIPKEAESFKQFKAKFHEDKWDELRKTHPTLPNIPRRTQTQTQAGPLAEPTTEENIPDFLKARFQAKTPIPAPGKPRITQQDILEHGSVGNEAFQRVAKAPIPAKK